jgi:phosphohistidine swiveling domain-containing protein
MVNREKFVETVNRPYPPLYNSIIFEGYVNRQVWNEFLGFDYALSDLIIVDGLWYYPQYHMIDFAEKIADKLFSEKGFFARIKKQTLQRESELLVAYKDDFETFCNKYSAFMPTLGIYFICDDLLEKRVNTLLHEKSDVRTASELMQKITQPIQMNYSAQEKIELVKTRNPAETVAKFPWINSKFGVIKNHTQKQAEQLLKKLDQSRFLEMYAQEKKETEDATKLAKKLIGKEHEQIVDVMQFFIYYRTHRTDVMNRMSFEYAEKLANIAQKSGISYEDILYCTHNEILSGIPPSNIIASRKQHNSFLGDGKEYSILTGQEHKTFLNTFSTQTNQATQTKGKPAFAGMVSGPVKVVRTLNDLKQVREGDIIVTSMTTPNMIPAMEKAAGFVTDEGGITCHAAIIAREMKKPCVIGTQTATKIFKNGDVVNVDAEKGIVKKTKN